MITASKYFSLYQDPKSKTFIIDFEHKKVSMTFCEFLSFRFKIYEMCEPSTLEEMIDANNIAVLSLCNKEHFVFLTVSEILDLKNLLENLFCQYSVV